MFEYKRMKRLSMFKKNPFKISSNKLIQSLVILSSFTILFVSCQDDYFNEDEEDEKVLVRIDTAHEYNTGYDFAKDFGSLFNFTSLRKLNDYEVTELPDEYDWRKDFKWNVVPPTEMQLPCDTCWIFASLSILESQYAIKTGKLVSFSKQQVLDCFQFTGKGGRCSGWGSMMDAHKYVKKAGIQATSTYGPYQKDAADHKCKYKKNKVLVYTVGDIISFVGHAAFLHMLFQSGPIGAVMINPKDYNGGIMTIKGEQCPSKKHPINHMVLIVGYGVSDKGVKYWIVKNSYGQNWGIQKGYFKIERGRNTLCIETMGMIVNIRVK